MSCKKPATQSAERILLESVTLRAQINECCLELGDLIAFSNNNELMVAIFLGSTRKIKPKAKRYRLYDVKNERRYAFWVNGVVQVHARYATYLTIEDILVKWINVL
jgi:hypothetical protein